MNILYVEDDPASVRVMKRIVKHLGHDLVVASTGQEAQDLLHDNIDLVLSDVDLPDIDGIQLIKQIRSQLPETTIIAVTAHAMAGDRDRCLDAGSNDYISKPFEYPTIAALIEHYKPGH